jgi:hypothetical protein
MVADEPVPRALLDRAFGLLERALAPSKRPSRLGWIRAWWTQSDASEALAAVHAVDEAIIDVRARPDLAARLPELHADLTRLLDERDPRRRDALRLADRLIDHEGLPSADVWRRDFDGSVEEDGPAVEPTGRDEPGPEGLRSR